MVFKWQLYAVCNVKSQFTPMLQLIEKWSVPGLTMADDSLAQTVTWKGMGPGWLLSDNGVRFVTW